MIFYWKQQNFGFLGFIEQIWKIEKFIPAAYTANNVNNADCIVPYKNELTIPNGEEINTSCKDILDIFLNVGAFLLVSKIGISAAEVITEINIKGWKLRGSLKLSKKIPSPMAPYRMTM